MAHDAEQAGSDGRHSLTLHRAAQQWPTARSHEAGDWQQRNHATPTLTLAGASKNWPTPSTAPDAPNANSNQKNGSPSRGLAAELWQTPAAAQHHTHHSGDLKHTYPLLTKQAARWSTPTARDFKGADLAGRQGKPSLPAQAQPPDGSAGSPSGRVLNPQFVEMLQGWPSGLTDYESSETASSRWWPLMRSVLLRLGWE